MQGNQLILNKGYKLQDINIISSATGTAVEIAHPTAGLASVDVKCSATGVNCVEVKGPGLHTLKDVRVDVAANSGNVGILNNTAGVNLSIVGGEVRLTGDGAAITLINSQKVLTATGLTVDMTDGGAHQKASTGITLNAAGSLVTGSIIKVSNNSSAKGIQVQSGANPSTVVGNTFFGSGSGYGVQGGNNLSPSALSKNTFVGTFTQVFPNLSTNALTRSAKLSTPSRSVAPTAHLSSLSITRKGDGKPSQTTFAVLSATRWG
jgi:hypothetical protein